MIILQRLIPYLATIAAISLLVVGLVWPQSWAWIALSLGALPLLCVIMFHQPPWRLEYIGLSLPMIILLLTSYSFLLIQEQLWLMIVAIAVAAICFFLFEKNIAIFLFQPTKYIPYSLEHVSMYCTMVAAFFCYVSLSIFAVLHISRLRYLFVVAAILTASLVWQTFWIQKIRWQQMWPFVGVITMVVAEQVIAFYYWPISFFATGGLLTLLLYLMLHLSRHHLMQTLTRKLVWRYVSISVVAAVAIVLTAKWYYT